VVAGASPSERERRLVDLADSLEQAADTPVFGHALTGQQAFR